MKTMILMATWAVAAMAQPNPSAQTVAKARHANYCADPWITVAIWDLTGSTRNPSGLGTLGECNPQLYNGGSWSSYAQLRRAVDETTRALSAGGARIVMQDNRNGTFTVQTMAGGATDRYTVTGRIVIDQGANIVASGAGNIVSHDGGTLITQDGGDRTVMSAGKARVRLPGGRVLIVGR